MKRNEMLKKINELGLQGKFSKEHNGMSYTYAQTDELSEFLSNNGGTTPKTEKQNQTKDTVVKQVIVPVNLLFTKEKLKKANELDKAIEEKTEKIANLGKQLKKFNDNKYPLVWLEKTQLHETEYTKIPYVSVPHSSYGSSFDCSVYIPHEDCKEFIVLYFEKKIQKIKDEISKLEEEFANINYE